MTNPSDNDAGSGPLVNTGELQPVDMSAKTVAEIFGEIVWLMTQDKSRHHVMIGDLETLIMPAVLFRQIKLFYAPQSHADLAALGLGPKAVTAPRAVGAVLWAMVSDAVARGLDANTEGKLRLTPQDWRSGNTHRVIKVIAPFGGAEDMLEAAASNPPAPPGGDAQ